MTLPANKNAASVEAVPEPAVPKKPPLPTLIIKGERHTGTHWLSQILRHNFPSKDQKLHLEPTIPGERCPFEQPFPEFRDVMCCWTSGLADDRCVYDSAPTVYVFVVRHPYPWLLSMKKKPFEYDRDAEGMTLSQYMRWPFVQFAKERIGVYANPLDMYNKKIRSYLNVTTHPKIILHHEDLYDLSTLNRKLLQPLLKHGFKLRANEKSLVYPKFHKFYGINAPDMYKFTPGNFDTAKAYATNRTAAMMQYTLADLRFMATHLDPSVLKAVNYTLERIPGGHADDNPESRVDPRKMSKLAKQFPTLVLKGERHTGTHWLTRILRHNFDEKDQRLHLEPTIPEDRCPFEQPFPEFRDTMCCWTSGLADDRCVYDTPPTVYVFLVRDPYPWLLSMRKKPFEYDRDAASMSISKYMRWPFTQFAQEGIGAYANPIDMYNTKIKSYMNLKDTFKIFLHQEDLYDLPTLNRKLLQPLLARGFKLKPTEVSALPQKALAFPKFSVELGKNNPELYKFTAGNFNGAKEYAAHRSVAVSMYSPADLRFMATHLDRGVMAAANYTVEKVPEKGNHRLKLAKQFPTLILKGERHTGTHWLSQILRHNFDDKNQRLHVDPTIPEDKCPFAQPFPEFRDTMCCWTSGKADDRCVYDSTPTVYVFMVRDPYPWLLSMKAHPFEYDRDAASMSLSEYMRFPFTQFAQEALGAYANPIDMYNTKIKSYMNLKDTFKIFLHQEDLYDLPTLNRKLLQPLLARGFKLKPADARETRETKEGKLKVKEGSFVYPEFSRDYGKNNPEIYKFTPGDFTGAKVHAENRSFATSQYTQSDMRFLASELDPNVMSAINYTLEGVAGERNEEDQALENSLYQGPSLIVRAERHTGSHFLSAVLRHVFPKEHNSIHAEPIMHSSDCPVSQPYAQQASCCWKHGFPDDHCEYTKPPSAYVFLIRQPYSWLLAMRANPYEYDCTWCASMGMSLENMSISEFIRRPYLQTDSNTALIARNNYSNPIQMWNDKTRSFLRIERPKVILRQEELFDIDALQRKLPPLAVRPRPRPRLRASRPHSRPAPRTPRPSPSLLPCTALRPPACCRAASLTDPPLPAQEYGFSMASTKVSFPPLNEEKSIRGEEVNSPLEYKFTQKGLDYARSKAITPASAFSAEDLKFIQSELDPEVLDAVGYGSLMQD